MTAAEAIHIGLKLLAAIGVIAVAFLAVTGVCVIWKLAVRDCSEERRQ